MPSQKPLSQKNSQQILSFAALLIIGLCLLIFTAASSAQQTVSNSRVIVNGNTRTANVAPTSEPAKSIVRGRVVYEDTGRPVRRTRIMLMDEKDGIGNGQSTITGSSGEFELHGVVEGKYSLVIKSPGVLNLFSPINPSEDAAGDSNRKIDEGDEQSANVTRSSEEIVVPGISTTVDVFIRAKRGGAISGKIAYADGDPAISVVVEALPKKELTSNGLARDANRNIGLNNLKVETDDRGVYRIVGLPLGEYIIRASEKTQHNDKADSDNYYREPSMLLLTTFYPDASEITKAAALKLELGQELSEINITLPERDLYKANGRIVMQKTQQSVRRAGISIWLKNEEISTDFSQGLRLEEIYTDENGTFGFKDLPAGIYKIRISPPGDYSDEEYDEKGNSKPKIAKPKLASIEKEIAIEKKDLENLVFELPLGGSVAGRIVTSDNKPLPENVFIFFKSINSEIYLSTTASGHSAEEKNQSANFKLDSAPAGKFQMSAYILDEGEKTKKKDQPSYYLKSIRRGGKDLLASPLELGDGENITDVQIILATDGGILVGKVRGRDADKPAVNRSICLVPVDEANWLNTWMWKCGVAQSGGAYELKSAPGNYFVVFPTKEDRRHNFFDNTEKQRAWIRERIGNAEKITIKPNETTTADLIAP